MKWSNATQGSKALLMGLRVGAILASVALVLLGACSSGDESTDEATVTVTPTSAPTDVVGPLEGQSYRFVFEKLGVDAPVEEFGLDENAMPVVPTGDNAAEVVAWYNFSAEPGRGNAVFAGHVNWFGDAVFAALSTSEPGDRIVLRGEDGTELTYAVSWVESLDPNDPESLKVMSSTDPPSDVITVITCSGDFQDTDDPVFGGEYSSRVVVRAERV